MASAERTPAPSPRRVFLLQAGAALIAAPASAAPRVYRISIGQMAFGPSPAGLRVGDTVEWINADMFRHTATARDRTFDVDLEPKARARTVLRTAGTTDFYCRYHPGMTGRLMVGRG